MDASETNTIYIRARSDTEKCPSSIAEWVSDQGEGTGYLNKDKNEIKKLDTITIMDL